MMSLNFRPISESHAIESCQATIRFVQPIDPNTFGIVRERAQVIAQETDLPARQEMTIPPFLSEAFGQVAPAGGVIFQRFSKNGAAEAQLRCENAAIHFASTQYAGWQAFRTSIEKTLLALAPLYLNTVSAVRGVALQYSDRFLGGPPSSACPASEIFLDSSPWVAQYAKGTAQPWHSHFGIFIPDGAQSRELINVNVNVDDEWEAPTGRERSVRVEFLAARNFDLPGQSALVVGSDEAEGVLGQIFDGLHGRHKSILKEVLAPEYLALIGAN